MPPSKQSIIPREGFVMDAVINVVKRFLLKPSLTLPIFLLLQYTRRGQDFSADHQTIFRGLKKLVWLGIAYRISRYLSRGMRNNWVKDAWVWEKEIAIVTGGSGGIGAHVVKGLADTGMKVVVLDVVEPTFEISKNVHFYKCDITSTARLAEVAEDIRTTVGHPTIVVNNAGVARGYTILDASERDIRFTFDVNILSHFWILKEFLPNMIKNDHGHIVTVASVAGYQAAAQMVDYGATKAAAISFHEGLTLELKHRYNAKKVRTTLVTQGLTKTPLFVGFKNDSRFLLPEQYPESVAEGIVHQILSGEGDHLLFPKAYGFLPGMRGQAGWVQVAVSEATKDLMSNWKGRQVIDPNSVAKETESPTEDVSKSGVLV